MIYIFVFIFGAIIGSFLNVVILRYNTGESVVYSGSRCLSCGKKLTWQELIPIFSFLIQKGRCRQCGSKISWQYPIIETITGIIFVSVVYKIFNFQFSISNQFSIFNFQSIFSLIFFWLIFSLLIIISVYDIRHQIIPNKFVYTLIILSLVSIFLDSPTLPDDIVGKVGAPTPLGVGVGIWDFLARILPGFLVGVGFFSFFGLLWLVSKGHWMGLGDAKIALASGWLLGPIGGLIALFMSFWLGAIFGVFLLLFAPKKFKLESRIPFGPFLALGTLIAFLFGNNILQIYLNIAGRI